MNNRKLKQLKKFQPKKPKLYYDLEGSIFGIGWYIKTYCYQKINIRKHIKKWGSL